MDTAGGRGAGQEPENSPFCCGSPLIGFGDGFWIAGVDACSGDKTGKGSLKERRRGPKVGLYVGRSMTELRPGSHESKVGGALVLGAQNWVC